MSCSRASRACLLPLKGRAKEKERNESELQGSRRHPEMAGPPEADPGALPDQQAGPRGSALPMSALELPGGPPLAVEHFEAEVSIHSDDVAVLISASGKIAQTYDFKDESNMVRSSLHDMRPFAMTPRRSRRSSAGWNAVVRRRRRHRIDRVPGHVRRSRLGGLPRRVLRGPATGGTGPAGL